MVAEHQHQRAWRKVASVGRQRGGDVLGHGIESLAERRPRFPQPRFDDVELQYIPATHLDPAERRRRAAAQSWFFAVARRAAGRERFGSVCE